MKKTETGASYPETTLAKARELYLQHTPLKKICEESGMKLDALKYHIGKKWKQERNLRRSELIDSMTEAKVVDLVEITKYGLTFLKNSLKHLVEESKVNPTPGLLKTISTIVFEINKIKALDEGKPTEILADIKPASVIEIKELISKDPFLEIEDATIKEEDEEIIGS
jgi:hypothetical protein